MYYYTERRELYNLADGKVNVATVWVHRIPRLYIIYHRRRYTALRFIYQCHLSRYFALLAARIRYGLIYLKGFYSSSVRLQKMVYRARGTRCGYRSGTTRVPRTDMPSYKLYYYT